MQFHRRIVIIVIHIYMGCKFIIFASMDIGDVTPLRNQFVGMVIRMGATQDEADDVVQEFFLQLCKIQKRDGDLNRLEYNGSGEVNMGYCRNGLRNQWLNLKSYQNRFVDTPIPDRIIQPISDLEIDVRGKLRELDHRADHVVFGQYYERLFMSFVMHNHTYRSFYAATEISVSTIFYEMKYLKNELKKHLTHDTN